ncbi:hypothetical protein D1872_304720 [compost metagenome]
MPFFRIPCHESPCEKSIQPPLIVQSAGDHRPGRIKRRVIVIQPVEIKHSRHPVLKKQQVVHPQVPVRPSHSRARKPIDVRHLRRPELGLDLPHKPIIPRRRCRLP